MAKRVDRYWRDKMTQGLNQQVNIDPNDLSDITCQKVLESLDIVKL